MKNPCFPVLRDARKHGLYRKNYLVTRAQLEAVNKRAPIEVSVRGLELRCKDHRAAVNRIDGNRTVVAPTRKARGLNAEARESVRFVTQRAGWIRRTAIGVTNAWHNARRVRDV